MSDTAFLAFIYAPVFVLWIIAENEACQSVALRQRDEHTADPIAYAALNRGADMIRARLREAQDAE